MIEKILEDLNERINTQLKIISGMNDEVYRYGYSKSLEAYQQARMIVEDAAEPVESTYEMSDKGEIIISCGNCDQVLRGDETYCYACGRKVKPGEVSEEFKQLIDQL